MYAIVGGGGIVTMAIRGGVWHKGQLAPSCRALGTMITEGCPPVSVKTTLNTSSLGLGGTTI